MVKLAISDYPYMEYSDLELLRTGITYTYDTIRQLKELYPSAELYFIIGGDSLEHLGQWYRIQELIYMTHFLAAGRADVDASKAAMLIQAYEEQYPGCKIHFLQTDAMDISSSALREMAARKAAIDAFVPQQVAAYIQERQLYVPVEE
jgi:nicotinate-nucleotide adenylyltransferase